MRKKLIFEQQNKSPSILYFLKSSPSLEKELGIFIISELISEKKNRKNLQTLK